jgi:transposase
MNVTTIGLDLAKSVFQVHGIDAHGKMLVTRQLRRGKVLEFFANLPACLAGHRGLSQRTPLGARDQQAWS